MEIELEKLKNIIEGAIYAADKPLSLDKLKDLFYLDDQPSTEQLQTVLAQLQDEYQSRGVELRELANGFRFQVRSELGPWVSRLWEDKPAKYSRALLETLALIAYRQPITRGEIEEIRGVSVSSHITKTLQERDWIRVVGHRDVPGRPAMYATTRLFLEYFNLTSLDELPSLAEIRDLDKINEELELVEKTDSQVPVEEVDSATEQPQEDTSGNNLLTDEAESDSNNKKSKVTLHDLAEKMAKIRDDSDLTPSDFEKMEPDFEAEVLETGAEPVERVDDTLVVSAEGPADEDRLSDSAGAEEVLQEASDSDAIDTEYSERQDLRDENSDLPETDLKHQSQEPMERIEAESISNGDDS
jgi:segregation and condensation protein B